MYDDSMSCFVVFVKLFKTYGMKSVPFLLEHVRQGS
jgi:hypothetical protein